MADDQEPISAVSRIKGKLPPPSPQSKRYSEEEKEFYSLRNVGLRQNIEERKKYAKWTFVLSCCWVTFVSLLLLAQGFGSTFHFFALTQPVLLAAIGSTTVNIVGVFLIVVRYLFRDDKDSG